jgi:hypothetical protein
MKDWKWNGFRNKFMPTIYDICFGTGRCVPYYIDYFGYIYIHDQSIVFVAYAAV